MSHKALDASRPAQAGSPESLRRADSLRAGAGEARIEAMSIYRDHAAAIDPATAEGELRVRWLLDSRRALAQEFEDLLLRAAQRAGDEGTRFAASIASAQFPQRRGDFKAAETILRRGLASVRGTQSRRETSAAMNLSGVFRAQHREFEALVTARRANRLAERLGQPGAVAATLVHVAATLVEIGEHAAFDAVARKLDALLPSLEPHEAAAMRRPLHRCRADSFADRGDHAAAEREVALRDTLPLESWTRDLVTAEDAYRRARMLTAAGRFEDVRGIVAAHHRPAGPRGRAWLEWTGLEIGCRARLCDRSGAAAAAAAFLDELERTGASALGATGALRLATHVGDALRDAPDGAEASARAYAFAETMMLARTVELDECLLELDELSTDAEEDRRLLASLRERFVREHDELLCVTTASPLWAI